MNPVNNSQTTSSAPSLPPPVAPPSGSQDVPVRTGTARTRTERTGTARIPDSVRELSSGSLKRDVHHWSRWLHVYTSMVAFVVVLFFAFTGLTLNHPQWTFGDDLNAATTTGQLEVEPTLDDGSVNYLGVSEYMRTRYGVVGQVDSFDVTNGQATIAYKNPGYAADVLFDVETGEFTLLVEQQGWVGVVNDLHKGRDTNTAWKWVIDISAVFLVVISLTGLVMQFFLRKRRVSGLTLAVVGGLATVVLTWLTLR